MMFESLLLSIVSFLLGSAASYVHLTRSETQNRIDDAANPYSEPGSPLVSYNSGVYDENSSRIDLDIIGDIDVESDELVALCDYDYDIEYDVFVDTEEVE